MVKIEITLDDAGNVSISAPLQNKVLCYGILELARQAVQNFKADGSHILVPPPGVKLT